MIKVCGQKHPRIVSDLKRVRKNRLFKKARLKLKVIFGMEPGVLFLMSLYTFKCVLSLAFGFCVSSEVSLFTFVQ